MEVRARHEQCPEDERESWLVAVHAIAIAAAHFRAQSNAMQERRSDGNGGHVVARGLRKTM